MLQQRQFRLKFLPAQITDQNSKIMHFFMFSKVTRITKSSITKFTFVHRQGCMVPHMLLIFFRSWETSTADLTSEFLVVELMVVSVMEKMFYNMTFAFIDPVEVTLTLVTVFCLFLETV